MTNQENYDYLDEFDVHLSSTRHIAPEEDASPRKLYFDYMVNNRFKSPKNTLEDVNLSLNPHFVRLNMLRNIAKHKNIAPKLLMELAQHDIPEIRLAAAENKFLPTVTREQIYKDIVTNQGYDDRQLLIDTLQSVNISSELRNKGTQKLFNIDPLVTQDREIRFPEEYTPELDSKDTEAIPASLNFSISPSRYFHHSLTKLLMSSEDLTVKTITSIINSGHLGAIDTVSKNKHLPREAYEILDKVVSSPAYSRFLLSSSSLYENPATPPEIIERMVESCVYDEGKFNLYSPHCVRAPLANALARSTFTPLKSLIALHSLYSPEVYRNIKGSHGNVASIWYFVEKNPVYLQWVQETPNYKELLPPVILCQQCTAQEEVEKVEFIKQQGVGQL